MKTEFSPRPSQRQVLTYRRGMLGVSAVPGSGKTHTLSALAAQIIASPHLLGPEQEVLIVTLVNSAVDNFSARIAASAGLAGPIPAFGYRVRTLHGLAHDIVREDPPLVGLDKAFTIVDEAASSTMIRDAARAWVRLHPEVRERYVKAGLNEGMLRQVESRHWPDLIEGISTSFIKAAKDRQLTPAALSRTLDQQPAPLELARMGAEIYASYQAALTYRGAVDFDDLIRFAAYMLNASPPLLERLRFRWPFILEDEAQDSSRLQESILSMLAGENGNWVRVGDPNQAIFETFTTADPTFLREFIRAHPSIPMPESGRCQPSVMDLANQLIKWTMHSHPIAEVRDALSEPLIKPSPAGDPQPNPPNDPSGISLDPSRFTSEDEIAAAVRSLHEWLPSHSESTVAVLCSTNDHAAKVVRALQARGIKCRELLRSTSPTRAVAGSLSHVLAYLSEPGASAKLAQAYKVWRRDWRSDKQHQLLYARTAELLGKLRLIEDFVAPSPVVRALHADEAIPDGAGELLEAVPQEERAEVQMELLLFRDQIARWLAATVLPVDQLVLTLGQDIFTQAPDLALAHKLALVMAQLAGENPQWRLPELTPQLNEIARNERKFIGFSADDSGFNPDDHKGEVVVATMHKAKGLEWDRVYMLSVNSYDFPSALPGDRFISEKWFLSDELNLEAEAIAQMESLAADSEFEFYEEHRATMQARLDYARERLRLLYVGITRSRSELIITWNTGRRGEAEPALALLALQGWWQSQHPESKA
ncbi:MAG TPA: ATP-dependent helicase [Anaerolineales bacterium]